MVLYSELKFYSSVFTFLGLLSKSRFREAYTHQLPVMMSTDSDVCFRSILSLSFSSCLLISLSLSRSPSCRAEMKLKLKRREASLLTSEFSSGLDGIDLQNTEKKPKDSVPFLSGRGRGGGAGEVQALDA